MANKEHTHIYILADSYGGERIHKNVKDVSLDQTYPVLLKSKFPGKRFSINTASFRKITELLPILKDVANDYDIFILQAGIVDAYPRPLSQKNTISQSFFAKSLRRIIRLNRAFFIRFFRSRPWSSVPEVENALREIFELLKNKTVLFINIAPVNSFQDKQTPGANKNILIYNAAIKEVCKVYPNVSLIDAYSAIKSAPEPEDLLHPTDSHLNVNGNILYATLLENTLGKL